MDALAPSDGDDESQLYCARSSYQVEARYKYRTYSQLLSMISLAHWFNSERLSQSVSHMIRRDSMFSAFRMVHTVWIRGAADVDCVISIKFYSELLNHVSKN